MAASPRQVLLDYFVPEGSRQLRCRARCDK
jgi:hypothetical protein